MIKLSNNFLDIKVYKILQSDWLGAFLLSTGESEFSQACGFHRITKATMLHHLKPKKAYIDGTIFLKICITNYVA